MKTLLLLRHGKSDWDAEYDLDHDRPLKKRGRRASKLMGRCLAAMGEAPDLVLTSTAVRARDTVALAAEAGNWGGVPVVELAELYETTPAAVLQLLHRRNDTAEILMLVGHEPTCSLLTGGLVGGATVQFPTAALARIDFQVDDWREVRPGEGTLVWLITPRLMTGLGWPG